MKRMTLMGLVASLALLTNATASTAYNSKANTAKALDPDAALAALDVTGFDATRVNSRTQTVAPADVPVVNVDPTTASSKGSAADN